MAFIVTGSLAIVGYIICMLIVEDAIQCGGNYSHINASIDILWKDTLTHSVILPLYFPSFYH
jgi:hypothetical protein